MTTNVKKISASLFLTQMITASTQAHTVQSQTYVKYNKFMTRFHLLSLSAHVE